MKDQETETKADESSTDDTKSAEDVMYPDTDETKDESEEEKSEEESTDDESKDDESSDDEDKSEEEKSEEDKDEESTEEVEYDLSFSDEIELKDADGNAVQLDPEDPLVQGLTGFLKEVGANKEQAQVAVDLYGRALKEMQNAQAAIDKEKEDANLKELNVDREKAIDRIKQVRQAAANAIGEEKAGTLMDGLLTAGSILIVEELVARLSDEGAGDPPDGGESEPKTAESIFYRKK